MGHSLLRVASYNIRKCVGLDRRRDPDRVLSVIAALEAEAVVLQEADRRLGNRPATLDPERIRAETGLRVVPIAESDVSLGWHGNAVLLHRDITVEAITRIDLPGLEPRGAVRVDVMRNGQQLRLIATHLGLTRSHRRRQLSVIAKAALADTPRPTVILGDFNEWRKDKGLEALDGAFAVHSPGLSFHAARPVAALDRIAVSHDLRLHDAGVTETAASRIASDHLPVWADLGLVA